MIPTAPGGQRAPHLAYRDGRLELAGLALDGLVGVHGTPFFLVSERRLVENFHALRNGFAASGARATLRYCAKTNHEAGVLRVMAREGAEVLASHGAEVELALACGFSAGRVAYQRPSPPAAEVASLLEAGVTRLHVLRPEDAALFTGLPSGGGGELRLSLRLRPGARRSLSPLAGLNARLGLSRAEALEVARRVARAPGARVDALNVYVGTQQGGVGAFDRALRAACGLAREMRSEGVAEIGEINLGGGVPSPTLARLGPGRLWRRWRDRRPRPEPAPEALAAFARSLGDRFHEAVDAAGLAPRPALALEPGRSIVGNATILVSRVVAAEGRWLFLDASRNYLGESPLLFCRELLPLTRRDGEADRFVHLSGCTLNTTDVLDLRRRLPALAAGDALAFCDAGAYSISRAARYAGMSPRVLLLGLDGVVREIRRPEGFAELAAPMSPELAPALETARRADEAG